MNVGIVTFPETKVAMVRHVGPPSREHETVRKLVKWRLEQGLLDQTVYRSYGLHHVDPAATVHRVDFCLSYDGRVAPNDYGISEQTIPAMRCALARDVGSRLNNQAARYLVEEWLPNSGESVDSRPVLFHYVNVGRMLQMKRRLLTFICRSREIDCDWLRARLFCGDLAGFSDLGVLDDSA